MNVKTLFVSIVLSCIIFSSVFVISNAIPAVEDNTYQISYSSYFGGNSVDYSWSFALDSEDNLYLTGIADSPDFPTTQNAYQTERPSYYSFFVSKFSNDGSTLFFSTWLGPANHSAFSNIRDISNIALDSKGNIIISGTTSSVDFPTTPDALYHSLTGKKDFFLSILSNDGSSLLYSTYLGGSDNEIIGSLSLDKDDNIYISGSTYSEDFPVTVNAYDKNNSGKLDMVICKFSPDGKTLEYATYLGGTENELILTTSMVFDSANNIILAGSTRSNDFPTTLNAFSSSYGGGVMVPPGSTVDYIECCGDAVVSKISANGSNLLYSTYLGGSSGEKAQGIAIDNDDNIYLAGTTRSINFPVSITAFDKSYNGDSTNTSFFGDGFISKFSANGSLVFSTYVGGSGLDEINCMTLGTNNQAIVGGFTSSADFPIINGDTSSPSGWDGFLAILSNDGSLVKFSTYLGGNGDEVISHIDQDSSGNIVVGGFTSSDNFPITSNAWSDTMKGYTNIFLVKLSTGATGSLISSTGSTKASPGFLAPIVLIALILVKKRNKST